MEASFELRRLGHVLLLIQDSADSAELVLVHRSNGVVACCGDCCKEAVVVDEGGSSSEKHQEHLPLQSISSKDTTWFITNNGSNCEL